MYKNKYAKNEYFTKLITVTHEGVTKHYLRGVNSGVKLEVDDYIFRTYYYCIRE